ncbi:PKD domain-containing protein [bacterium]|nr:PKD domain-containing protein [bacterium]
MRSSLGQFPAVALLSLLVLMPGAARAQQDTDRDGLPDAVEEQLATDPQFAEPLQAVGTFTRPVSDKGAMQFAQVQFGNAGQHRWLWAIHFQKPYSFANSTLILYLDADNNPQTGRTGMGCEYMFSHNEGLGGVTAFAPDGGPAVGSNARVALHAGVLYMCVDCPIKQEHGKSVFRYTVLSEYREPHTGADSTAWVNATGPADSDKKVILTIDQIASDEHFLTTEGLDLIWKLQADPANVCLRTPDAELKNMRYHDTEYRWWAVTGANGSLTVTVPKAGTFFPAVVAYDSAGAETYQVLLDGQPLGHFVAAEDDRRQRIHFLDKPVAFKGGEKLTVKVGSVGPHITEDVMLLAQQPPIRGRKFEIQQIESGLTRVEGQDVMRLTWITTWPAACKVEYWPVGAQFTAPGEGATAEGAMNRATTEPVPVANHRVFLSGLRPGTKYGFRILAPKPDGTPVQSPDQSFTFQLPRPLVGTAKRERTPLRIENPYDFPVNDACISTGVPFAQGELGDPTQVRLLAGDGTEKPVQVKPTAYWLDGSIKWLLVTFLESAGPKQIVTDQLEYGSQVQRQAFGSGLELKQEGKQLTVNTGRLRVSFDAGKSALPTAVSFDTDSGRETATQLPWATMKDASGNPFDTLHAPERIEIEEEGPIRTIVKVVGHHQDAAGKPFMAYIIRYVFANEQTAFRVYYTFGNDEASDMTGFKGLTLSLPVGPDGKWTTSVDGQVRAGTKHLSVRQIDDGVCSVNGEGGGSPTTRRADGWVDVSGAKTGLTVAVRDFWQQYPKGFEVFENRIEARLCPEFVSGTYDQRDMMDEVKLYYYLRNGQYTVRQGVQKQHELLIAPHSGGVAKELRDELTAFQEPLIATCTPERYCGTQVFGDILPATAGRSAEYERICENVHRAYTTNRDTSRNFGMLNFGDQFGERRINWANGEYDHHHAFLMQYIRTGDRKWYFLGEKAARHAIDVDTCHYGPRLGGEWIHAMGHTGGYYTKDPFGGLGISGGGFSPSHTWTEGFCDWFALSGDVTASENAALVADHYGGAYLNNYDYGNCRDNGWHLLLTMAAYHATNDPYYLNAARIIVQRTLERVTPGDKPGTSVGWHRQMVPGHCLDMPRHRGEANFMLGVLANGLEVYYGDLPDPRVAEAVKGGATMAVKEMWVPECDGFRYTSCPNMKGYTANNDMTAEVLFFAYRLGGDPQYGEIAMRAMAAAFRDGIGSIAHLRWTPRIINNMDLLRREGLWFAPTQGSVASRPAVRIVLRSDKAQSFNISLTGQKPVQWSSLATLATPDGKTLQADDDGLLALENAPPGYYTLTVAAVPTAWQMDTTLRYWVVDASQGVVLQVGKMPSLLRYHGGATAALTARQGKPTIGKPATTGGVASVTVSGPGQIVAKLGGQPWLSLGWGELMDPSVPLVSIEGPRALLPGVLSAEYRAQVTDLDDDAVSYVWDFGDGQTVQGQSVRHTFAAMGRQRVRVTVTDKAGHRADAEIGVSLPPAELATAKPEQVIALEAEDFADQGGDKVQVFDRIGNSGRMISYWDATRGHWLEWKLPVRTTGDYVIYLRYCSGAPQAPRRALTIDGKSPGAPFDEMTLPLTGGFCTGGDNWVYYAAGGGQTVRLEAGEHRLRLTNLGDGVGLDTILLVRR